MKTKARCCGLRVTIDGTFHCDRIPVAAWTWDGCPMNFEGKPGAAACDEHEFAMREQFEQYPNLQQIRRLDGRILYWCRQCHGVKRLRPTGRPMMCHGDFHRQMLDPLQHCVMAGECDWRGKRAALK